MIEGVIHTSLSVFQSGKGAVLRAMRRDDDGYNGFREAYFQPLTKEKLRLGRNIR